MAIIGYARVSTTHQKLDSQLEALQEYGVDKIYQEYDSGRNKNRVVLEEVLGQLQPGDTLVIFKLDRLARGTQHLLKLLEDFEERHINFVSIQNHIDTTTPMGKLIFTIMGAFAEMEAALIRERVLAGLKTARTKGVKLGRPSVTEQINEAIELYTGSELTTKEIVERSGVSVTTLYRHINKRQLPLRG
ncbi:recombinase family protein [uncultured Vagococcus sp.]|uniref:recombinase family protein n=1 Tax=uncultured Vagococcus sp. TaxID=189676 RepID=UPI0028D86970|nr:recombinase family protein [uncultured Vagococcus sp.]